MAFAVLTMLALIQLLLLADVADRYWAWTIRTEQTAAFLGAAYAAGFVLSVLSLRMTRWRLIRIPVGTVAVFTWLTLAATLDHLHRFHLLTGGPFAAAAAWIWLGIYVGVPIVCVVVVVRQERHRGPPERVVRPMPGWLTGLLAVEGMVLLAAGVLLFAGGMTVHHHEATDVVGFWPWGLTPLSSMVIGAWVIAFGVAAFWVIQDGDLSRLLVSGVTYTAFAVFEFVAVIWHWPQVSAKDPWLWAYLAVLAVILVTGVYGWWAARRGPSADDDRGRRATAAPSASAGQT